MRELSMLALVGALAAASIGGAVAPAAANPLGVDFNSPPTTTGSCAPTLECNGFLTYGYAFEVGSAPITVIALGTFDNGSTVNLNDGMTVGLWDSSGDLLASVAVAAGADQVGLWAFTTLTDPVTLSADTTYVVGSEGDGAFLAGSLDPDILDISVNPAITFIGDRYSNPADTFIFEYPTETDANGPGYFGGNIEIDPIPEPMTLTLFGAALGGFGFMRRRKKA